MALEPITRQEQIIAGKGLTPITRMEKFLKEFGGGSGNGGADWNAAEGEPGHVLNRTHYEEVTQAFEPIVWDGNTEGLESITISGMNLYKIADYAPITSVEQVSDITTKYVKDGVAGEGVTDQTTLPNLFQFSEHGFMVNLDVYMVLCSDGQFDMGGSTVLPSGTWLFEQAQAAQYESLSFTINPATTTVLKTIDPKYLPESVATKEYVENLLGVIENGTY